MTYALDITDLWKSFDRVDAVKGISLSIEPGEIFGLLGPNGAGKSTTINMVSGVCRIDRGSIRIFGHDNVRDYRTTRRLTGVMHQEIVIDNFFTIDQALLIHSGYYGVKDDPKWRQTLIDRLGLGPHLHKVMLKLSGGLKRRFMIAKALIHRPRLLILDEPTAGVDVELRHTLWDFVREINAGGTTVLLTTHYIEEAEKMCGRIAIMNHGELVAVEKTAALVERLGGRHLSVRFRRSVTTLPAELEPFHPSTTPEPDVVEFRLEPGREGGDLLDALRGSGLEIADVETHRPNLEEVFLQLTGLGRSGKEGRRA